MNGGGTDTLNNNIATKEVRLKDILTGSDNSSKISTSANVLTVDSVGPNDTATSTEFKLRNTANTVITPLQLTTTINNMSVPLDMTGGNSELSTVRSRVYSFRDVNGGSITTSRIYQDLSNIVIDAAENNSAINFQTKTSGGTVVLPLSVQSSQITSNVALDMINTDATTFGYLNASIRSRIYLLRDLTTSAITSCGMYFSGNILQIDSDSGVASTNTSMFLRTKKSSGTLTNALQLTNTTVKTDCYDVTALPTTDNTNTIPTTNWVQRLLSSYIPASTVKRAWAKGFNVQNSSLSYIINIPNCGENSEIYSQNEMITFRIEFNQEWNILPSSPGNNQSFTSTSCKLNLYPQRFNAGWLRQSGGSINQLTRGSISDNVINVSDTTTTFTTNSYTANNTTFTPRGRQFWSYDLTFIQSPSVTARLNIGGVSGNVDQVVIAVINPTGFSAALTPQCFNLSIELLNPSELTSNITTTGFDVNL